MTLDAWLTDATLSNDAFAALLSARVGREVHRVTVSQYRRHQRVPQKAFMVAIYAVTGGDVRPDDFYDLPSLPQTTQLCAAPARESEAA